MKHQARRIEIDISKGRMLSCGIDDLVKVRGITVEYHKVKEGSVSRPLYFFLFFLI